MGLNVLGIATCFNRKEKTLNAIWGLRTGNPSLNFSFIITDDNSSDGTAEAISQIKGVTVIKGNGESYYTGGMRLAIAEALDKYSGNPYGYSSWPEAKRAQWDAQVPDFILLFNDDVEFKPGAIEMLIEKYDKKSGRVMVGPTCEEDGVTLSYGGIMRTSNWKPKFKIVKAEDGDIRKVNTFNANCVLIPRDIFVKTGNMDPVYHHSLGDFDYGYMIGKNGGGIYVVSDYVGVCPNNSEAGTWRDNSLPRKERFRKKESIKGVPFKEFYHYILKNYNFPAAVIFSISPYIRILLGK